MTSTEWIFIGIAVLGIALVVILVWNDARKRAKWAKDKAAKQGDAPLPIDAKPADTKKKRTGKKKKREENKESIEIHTNDKTEEDWLTRTYTSQTTNMSMLLKQEAAALTEPERLNSRSRDQDILSPNKQHRLRFNNHWESEIFQNQIVPSSHRATQSTAKDKEGYEWRDEGYGKNKANYGEGYAQNDKGYGKGYEGGYRGDPDDSELKSIKSQIEELSPEMKAVLFADVLKRKG